ncbi:MAG: dienelactone hydrolase family protein [Cocleimonas sp.]
MKVVIVTDIYGLCASTDNLISFLKRDVSEVVVIDPYQGKRYSFESEKEAYNVFVKKCGHEAYLRKAKELVTTIKPKLIIGFSAGANIAWRMSDCESVLCKQMLCFYPTQIRNHLDIKPNVLTEVIFPQAEESFDVNGLSEKIQLLPNVTTQVSIYQHGFMNLTSKTYSEKANKFGLDEIEKYL